MSSMSLALPDAPNALKAPRQRAAKSPRQRAAKAASSEKTKATLHLLASVLRRARIKAVEEDRTVSDVVESCLDAFLPKYTVIPYGARGGDSAAPVDNEGIVKAHG